MKILHTADWHLGKALSHYSLIDDQVFILGELKSLIIKENINVLIIAGDIYDKSIPSVESMNLLDNFLCEIINESSVKILAVPGNHDNATRLSFGNRLYNSKGLHIAGDIRADMQKLTLNDELGTVNFFFLPYFSLEKISNIFKTKFKNLSEAFSTIIEYNKPNINLKERNILIAHGYFSYFQKEKNAFVDLELTERELPVGGADVIDISAADFFDYIALGHIHTPQKVAKENIRYSGSLLKYSIAEAQKKKSITIINAVQKGSFKITQKSLPVLHDLRKVSGFIDEITRNPQKYIKDQTDYVYVELLDTEVFDGMFRLRQVFENVLGFSVVSNMDIDFKQTIEIGTDQNLMDKFKKFYKAITNNDLEADQIEILEKVIKEINE